MSPVDNVTHIAVAGTLGYALRTRGAISWKHVGVMCAAAVLPDIDWITGWFAPAFYLRNYHGATHSLIGAAILVALVGFAAKRYAGVAQPWVAAAIGVGTHLFLDGFTGFGEQLLWPLDKRFGMTLVANYDGPTLAILAAFLIFPRC